MSPHVRGAFARALQAVDDWEQANGGYNYATQRFLAFGTNELKRCYVKWTDAERRAMHASRSGRNRRAKHHSKAITSWFMRATRARAVVVRNLSPNPRVDLAGASPAQVQRVVGQTSEDA